MEDSKKQNILYAIRQNCSIEELKNGNGDLLIFSVLKGVIISQIFFENLVMALVLIPYIVFDFKGKVKEREQENRRKYLGKFRDGMMSVSFALNVGYSIENAYKEAISELILIYGQKDEIVSDYRTIVNRLARNENLEDILEDYAKQKDLEDIKYFSEIFRYAKRSGGDLIGIIKTTSKNISQKADVSNEIQTVISGKRMEQKVMSLIPFGIVLYLKLTCRDFIAPLFGNAFGMLVMLICLIVYIFSDYLGKRITNIDV